MDTTPNNPRYNPQGGPQGGPYGSRQGSMVPNMQMGAQPFGGQAYGPDGYPAGGSAPGGINLWYILRVLRKWWWLIGMNLGVAPVGRSRLIKVSFQHSDPSKAALITNSLTDSFINNSVSRKFNATAYARDFLETRLAAVKTSLENAERDLVE